MAIYLWIDIVAGWGVYLSKVGVKRIIYRKHGASHGRVERAVDTTCSIIYGDVNCAVQCSAVVTASACRLHSSFLSRQLL